MPRALLIALTLVAAAAVAAILARSGPARSRPAGASSPLLAVLPYRVPLQVARLDPKTLRPRGSARVDVGYRSCAPREGGEACWSIPPWSLAGGRLAVASNRDQAVRSIRVVDAAGPRLRANIPLTGGPVGLVAWVGPDRLLAVQEICCDERQQLLTLDAARRGILAAVPFGGSVLRAARTPHELVTLVTPPNAIGVPRLEVAGGDGIVRTVTLDRLRAGVRVSDPVAHRVEERVPGLAVDPGGQRAFVVAPGLVAEVRLADLAVAYHRLARPVSLLERVRDWFEPVAEAKSARGPVITAAWAGDGRLAVVGAGLRLVDTGDWRLREVDPEASDVRVEGDLLLATGARSGLRAYDLDGRERFRLFGREAVWVADTYRGRAYVEFPDGDAVRVVDLARGRVTDRRPAPVPWLIAGHPASWWE
jgi:hypothetical protein